MKCLVTGATGFIGNALCRELAAGGNELVLLGHSNSESPVDGVTLHAIDLASDAIPAALLVDVSVVFHCAGIAHQRASEAAYQRVNHEATLELARAAAAAHVDRFVFISSVKADANAASPYAAWKGRTEQALAALATELDLPIKCLRPALVYGPGVGANLAALVRGVRRRMPLPPHGGARSMVGLDDLVAAIIAVGADPAAGCQVYTATDGQAYSARRLCLSIAKALGRSAPLPWLPRWGWRLCCTALDFVQQETPGCTWQKLFGEELYSHAALTEALGWQPRGSFEQALPTILEAQA